MFWSRNPCFHPFKRLGEKIKGNSKWKKRGCGLRKTEEKVIAKMHEDGDFYVFLPSDGDTRGIYPKNTRGEFTIPIAPPIDCTEIKKIWEVAITDVTIPTSVYNISEEMDRRICVGSFNANKPHDAGLYGEFEFPAGQYKPLEFVEVFNEFLRYMNVWAVKPGKWGLDTKKKVINVDNTLTPALPYNPTAAHVERSDAYYRYAGAPSRISTPTKKKKLKTGEGEGQAMIVLSDEEADDETEDELIKSIQADPLETVKEDEHFDDALFDVPFTKKVIPVLKAEDGKAGNEGLVDFVRGRVSSREFPPAIIADRLIEGQKKPTSGFGIRVGFNEKLRKLIFKFSAPNNPWIWIPNKAFRFLLGFSDNVEGERIICPSPKKGQSITKVILSGALNLNFYVEDMFIYSDIVQYTRVGSGNAPILDVINVSEAVQAEYIDSKQYQIKQPKYIKCIHQCINAITIRILDSAGNHFGFGHGRVRVGLHFRWYPRKFR